MMVKEVFESNDYYDQLRKDGHTYKVRRISGGKFYYEEIDLADYDKRIEVLARKLASMPQVDLLTVVKDALYDLPLERLDKVESMMELEIKKSKTEKKKPDIKTTPRKRGTCVNLAIGGKFALNLRQ